MTDADIRAFNQRASQDESLVGRSLFTAGITWPGRGPVGRHQGARLSGVAPGGRREAAGMCRPLRRRVPQLPAGGARRTHQGGSGRRLDDVVRRADQAARDPHHRPVVPHQRAVSLSRLSRSRGACRAARADGDQRLAGSACLRSRACRPPSTRSPDSTPRRAPPIACAAGCSTPRTSSTSRCRRRRGSGWGSGFRHRGAVGRQPLAKSFYRRSGIRRSGVLVKRSFPELLAS